MTITFDPVVVAEQNEVRKTVLLLEDREEIVWLISALLSDEYEVRSVRSVQLAFERCISPHRLYFWWICLCMPMRKVLL